METLQSSTRDLWLVKIGAHQAGFVRFRYDRNEAGKWRESIQITSVQKHDLDWVQYFSKKYEVMMTHPSGPTPRGADVLGI